MGPCGEMVDETIHDALRREDADQSHVVLDADRLAVTEFLNEPADCERIEDAVLAHLVVREQVVEVSGFVAGKEGTPSGCAVRLLGALPDGRRYEVACDVLQ